MYTSEQSFLEAVEVESIRQPMRLARELYNVAELHEEALKLIAAREFIKHDDWEQEPEINARTALFEELTAKGHLSGIEFEGDVDVINAQTLRRLLNGWSENLPQWEKERRIAEIAEELIVQRVWQDIKTGKLSKDTIIVTVSDYPEMAPEDSAHTIGYRALNHKGMVRTHFFKESEDGQLHRVVEQISRSNSNNGSSYDFLSSIASDLSITNGSQSILSNQVITTRQELPGGVVDVQRILDKFAGESTLYGEDTTRIVDAHRLPGYEDLREISAAREWQAEDYIKRLADFERRLNIRYKNGEISYQQKLAEIYEERTKIVDEICLLNPSYARDARGELSAKYYEKAALAMAEGDHQAGMRYAESAINSADPMASVVCGGIGQNEKQTVSKGTAETYASAMANRRNWRWMLGYCIVANCPGGKKRVEVGPCDVCRHCQILFDRGMTHDEISSDYKTRQVSSSGSSQKQKGQPGFVEMSAAVMNEFEQKRKQKELERHAREERERHGQKAA